MTRTILEKIKTLPCPKCGHEAHISYESKTTGSPALWFGVAWVILFFAAFLVGLKLGLEAS